MWNTITGWFLGTLEYFIPSLFPRKAKLLFLGLDHAGKSTLMYRLVTGKMGAPVPTEKPTTEELKVGNITFTAVDVGGHKQARRVWMDYYYAVDGIVYIIDGSNRKRFEESKPELLKLLAEEELKEIPVAVLVNKIDIPHCASDQEVICIFDLYDHLATKEDAKRTGKRPLQVFPVSVLREQGYGDAFHWIASIMR